PPDVEALGRSTWTFLHTLSASYPPSASPGTQSEMRQFLGLFSRLYPCWTCAEDFQEWMGTKGNEPRVEGRAGLGRWMCQAHNEVNRKLGKEEFECARWEERWRTGWEDGR
ncbi:ERV/ALR sulfhydryl oxidase domain-containing protein, partial [Usnea florida]